ncbi:MAG: class I SAM-dependent methyltransferase [Gammaproteobacteria bacterium]
MINRQKIAEIKVWHHSIELTDGIITNGIISNKKLHEKFEYLKLPKDLHDKRILDVGCAEGFYSFECEKRGAEVTAIDFDDREFGNQGFQLCKETLNSKVKYINMDAHDITPENAGGGGNMT